MSLVKSKQDFNQMKKPAVIKEKGSTVFLRVAIVVLALIVLGLCALILPEVSGSWQPLLRDIEATRYPILFCLTFAALSFWTALFQGWKLLNYIDKNKAFSNASVQALKTMQLCSFLISGLFVACWPVMFFLAQLDDAPGVIIIYGIIFVGAPLVFGIALGVFQRLLKSAINFKTENELTV